MSHDRTPPPARVIIAVAVTFAIMFVAPVLPYGLLALMTGMQPPGGDSPGSFVLGVVVMKVGVAVGFVLIYTLGRRSLSDRWLTYGVVWWAMYTVVEIGQAIAPGYTWVEAGAGILAEAIYFPASAWFIRRLLG